MTDLPNDPKPEEKTCQCQCRTAPKSFFSRNKGCLIGLFVISFILFIFGIGFFGLVTIIATFNSNLNSSQEAVISGYGTNKIAVINIDGVIVEQEPTRGISTFTEEYTSARRIKKILSEIAKDEAVKGVILRINSPGGSAVASEEIYRDLLDFKKQTNLKIVSYFSDIAASGGYYIAMASDQIVANPHTITGSIGVIISYLNFQDLADKYGVKNIVYKSGQYKDIVSEFRQPTEAEKQIMQSLINDAYEVFVNAVSQGRKIPQEKTKELADGRVFSAEQAKTQGLVDSLGSFEDTVTLLKKLTQLKEAKVVEFGQPTFLETLLGGLFGKLNLNLASQLNGIFGFKPGLRILYLYSP